MQDISAHFSTAADKATHQAIIQKAQAIETIARGYDGTEKATDRLRALYVSFHQALWRFAGGHKSSAPPRWADGDLMSVSVNPAPSMAYQMAYNRLAQIQTRFAEQCVHNPGLLPIHDPGYRFLCAGAPGAAQQLSSFIKEGFQRGIYRDDLILTRGRTDDGHEIILMAIPRLDKELLLQGSAITVSQGRQGPLFYAVFDEGKYPTSWGGATYPADPLDDSLWDFLVPSGYPGPKIKITARDRCTPPLSHDIILAERARYAAKHMGCDPQRRSGYVEGVPHETWALWDDDLKKGRRLPEGSMTKGLDDLFRTVPLTAPVPDRAQQFTVDQILTAALFFASRNKLALPDAKAGLVEGLAPLDWKAVDNRLRYKSHGTDLPANSLRQLYYIYGLCGKKNPNLDVIAEACANVTAGRAHGLTPEPYRALMPARHPLRHKQV